MGSGALPHRPSLGQNPVHRSPRAQVRAFAEQRPVHLPRWLVDETLRVEHGQDRIAFGTREPSMGWLRRVSTTLSRFGLIDPAPVRPR